MMILYGNRCLVEKVLYRCFIYVILLKLLTTYSLTFEIITIVSVRGGKGVCFSVELVKFIKVYFFQTKMDNRSYFT